MLRDKGPRKRSVTRAIINRLVFRAQRELAEAKRPPIVMLSVKDEEISLKVNAHLFVVRGHCPVCCIDKMLDNIRRAVLSSRSCMTAMEKLAALSVGDTLIELRASKLEDGHVVEE